MDNDTLKELCRVLCIIDHTIDNAKPMLEDLDKHEMFSRPSRKYVAVNLRFGMYRLQVEMRDFLKEVVGYEESQNDSNLPA